MSDCFEKFFQSVAQAPRLCQVQAKAAGTEARPTAFS